MLRILVVMLAIVDIVLEGLGPRNVVDLGNIVTEGLQSTKELIEAQKERQRERERGMQRDGKVKSDGEDTPISFTPGMLWKGAAGKIFGGRSVLTISGLIAS